MKTTGKRDYTKMTELAAKLGFERNINRAGFYTMKGLNAEVDLTASAEDEISILKNAVRQLSEQADKSYNKMI